ncbi:ATP-binding protein [Streptomyces nigra]|uniref:ATP-binding protein n=1 Tax=Streptomyces nigra TaxID=1827580 RepID=UPI003646F483
MLRPPTIVLPGRTTGVGLAGWLSWCATTRSGKRWGTEQVSVIPDDLTTFVGRRQAVPEVRRLLARSRLVTLAGVAGVGKSRLAREVVRNSDRAFPGGVCLVELTELTESALAMQAATVGIDLRNWQAPDAWTAFAEMLAVRPFLLLLDNCDSVLDGTARLVESLLASTPGVRVLATSREPLGVRGEQVWPVAPLSLPDEGAYVSGTAGHFDAPALFQVRARAVNPGFAIDSSNEEAVVRLCQRLDGLPLAIELAAVRTSVLSVEQILARLDDRFNLLSRGNRSSPPRHHSLRAAVEWSYDLCTQLERTLWARLSVFPADFDLEAAESVCSEAGMTEEEVLSGLDGLLNRSILERARHSEDKLARYRMLETIRAYGHERLEEQGELRKRQHAHRDYYLSLAERGYRECSGAHQSAWFKRLRAERPNVWAALDFCLTCPGEAAAGLRMAGALAFSWIATGALQEGRYWLDRTLNAEVPEQSAHRARALWANGLLRAAQGDLNAAVPPLIEARGLAHQLKDDSAYACAVHLLNIVHHLRETPRESYTRQLPSSTPSVAVEVLAVLDLVTHASALLTNDDTLQQGVDLLQACRDECTWAGDELQRSWALVALGIAYWRQGKGDRSLDSVRTAVGIARSYGDVLITGLSVEIAAWVVCDQQPEVAARLLGASSGLWRPAGTHLFGVPRLLAPHQDCHRRVRIALGQGAFMSAYGEGSRSTVDEAAALLLDDNTARTAKTSAGVTLTEREWEVAAKVAEGMSNRKIAQALIISQRTVETHVENVLRKLGFTSRTQIAVWLTQQGHRTNSLFSP